MIRKSLAFLSLIGLVISLGLLGMSYVPVMYSRHDVPILGSATLWCRNGVLFLLTEHRCPIYISPVADPVITDIIIADLELSGLELLGWASPAEGLFWGEDVEWKTLRNSWMWLPEWYKRANTISVKMPLYILVLLFVAQPVALLASRRRRRQRQRRGLCMGCGYDLRGLTTRLSRV